MEKAFSFRQAEALKKIFKKHRVAYLFLGKSGAILLGYSDTTQDADVFVKKDPDNTKRLIRALKELHFKLTQEMEKDVLRVKDRESLPRLKSFRDYWKKTS